LRGEKRLRNLDSIEWGRFMSLLPVEKWALLS
jgi:hypothetical protein